MKKYILKRFLSLIPTVLIVSVVVFLLVHLTPGDAEIEQCKAWAASAIK